MVPTTAWILFLLAVRLTMPTPVCSPGQGWVSAHCSELSLIQGS